MTQNETNNDPIRGFIILGCGALRADSVLFWHNASLEEISTLG